LFLGESCTFPYSNKKSEQKILVEQSSDQFLKRKTDFLETPYYEFRTLLFKLGQKRLHWLANDDINSIIKTLEGFF
jgi:hypothetical protein